VIADQTETIEALHDGRLDGFMPVELPAHAMNPEPLHA
jgi:hypothetical protein